MEWAVAIPVIALLLLCPLMMIAMMAGGWIFGRRLTGGHGMMCMGHGSHAGHEDHVGARSGDLLAELRAERERLDRIIAQAEERGALERS